MRWRAPRFTLLLTGLVALAALAIVLSGGGPGPVRAPGPPAQIGGGRRQQACITTQAEASNTARGAARATATGRAPLTVSQTVVGPRGAVTVTHGGTFTASVQARRDLSVTQRSVARARACASAPSLTAARGLAVRRAYALARARARALARADAQRALRGLERRVEPLLRVQARVAAQRRAQALAESHRPALIRGARRRAAVQAGAA